MLSSKTNRYKNRKFEIPLGRIDNTWFCVHTMLKWQFALFPAPATSPLFRRRLGKGSVPLTYSELLGFLKRAVSWIGLDPANVGLHSLRRSGAGFLHGMGVPLQNIRSIGDWSSYNVTSKTYFLLTKIVF